MNKAVWLILKQLLKAALRIEKKLDEVLKMADTAAKAQGKNLSFGPEPLSYATQSPCPLCRRPVVYQPVQILGLNGVEQVLIRVCGCEPVASEMPINEGDVP